jgi:hypothetical protein
VGPAGRDPNTAMPPAVPEAPQPEEGVEVENRAMALSRPPHRALAVSRRIADLAASPPATLLHPPQLLSSLAVKSMENIREKW